MKTLGSEHRARFQVQDEELSSNQKTVFKLNNSLVKPDTKRTCSQASSNKVNN